MDAVVSDHIGCEEVDVVRIFVTFTVFLHEFLCFIFGVMVVDLMPILPEFQKITFPQLFKISTTFVNPL